MELSELDFGDAVPRPIIVAATYGSSFTDETLRSNVLQTRSLEQSNIISRKIPYEVRTPVTFSRAFRIFGAEGGNEISRLKTEKRESLIYAQPLEIFGSYDDFTLYRMRGVNIRSWFAEELGTALMKFRQDSLYDTLYRVHADNAAAGYPAMSIGSDASPEPFNYDTTLEMVHRFAEHFSDISGWNVHWDFRSHLQGLADTVPEPGEKRWVTREGQRLYMHGFPVYFNVNADAEVQYLNEDSELEEYNRYGLYYTYAVPGEDPEDRYRVYLSAKNTYAEYIGFSPPSRPYDRPQIPAGTAGYPEQGMSAGISVFLQMLLGPQIQIPRNRWDRISTALLTTVLP